MGLFPEISLHMEKYRNHAIPKIENVLPQILHSHTFKLWREQI